jgi:hypothetical protein
MGKVFLDELTWREANEAIERGAPVFLPVGPIEGHGPHIPLGCDYYIATAVAKLMAGKSNGIALPPLTYTYSGGTSTFKGAVSVPIDVTVQMLKAIIRSLWEQGFKRILILSGHIPDEMTAGTAIRTVFEEDNIPAVYINPYSHIDEELLKQRIRNYDRRHKESVMACAAARILGKENAIPDLEALRDEDPSEDEMLPESLRKIQEYGMVGYHYTHELQHIPQRANIDVESGIRVLNDVAERLLPAVQALGDYVRWLEENPRTFIAPPKLV